MTLLVVHQKQCCETPEPIPSSAPTSHTPLPPDLFGRGYSDAPTDLPYDTRLYTTQILLALASSPLSWTGSGAFSLAGYSLGGGIAADFTSHFPHLVSSLILLAPGGLIRTAHITWRSRLLYSLPLLPQPLVHWLVRRRLYTPPSSPIPPLATTSSSAVPVDQTAQAEAAAPPTASPSPSTSSQVHTAAEAVNWQLDHHPGFLPAFISSIRHAPVYAQHARWHVVGAQKTPVLLVLGGKDPIVVADEVWADAEECLGEGLETVVVEGAGHEVVMGWAGETVVEAMVGFLEGGKGR